MTTYNGGKTLDTQKTTFEEIQWSKPDVTTIQRDTDVVVAGVPPGVGAGLPYSCDELMEGRAPYWEFIYRIDSAVGLVITDVVARGTQHTGTTVLSTEQVFKRIDFTDLTITFDDGSSATFNTARALGGRSVSFEFGMDGSHTTTNPPDTLMQYGLRLSLTDNVLAGTGTCNVTLEFAVVFRGATNDFDPAGVPVAMGCYPQLAYSWAAEGATKRVAKFRGSVRITTDNVMSDYMHHGGPHPPARNIPGFYTDSNASMMYLGDPNNMTPLDSRIVLDSRASLYGLKVIGGRVLQMPASWGMVFDYLHAGDDFSQEKEIVAVYGPNDGNFYSATLQRRANYVWPVGGMAAQYNAFVVIKTNRQGQYDNFHLHADMGRLDINGNTQIHAPFCGHSCVHMHWRWSGLAGRSAGDRSWYFKGWSGPDGGIPAAHSVPGAPLVPPNQRVKFAVCAPRTARHNADNIIDPAAPAALPPRNKMIWYCADIFEPAAGRKQVIFEQGLGWAYRYALQDESTAVKDLASLKAFLPIVDHWIFGVLPVPGSPSTQAEMADFFENYVYPGMRYLNRFGVKVNQIPNGSYDRTHVWGSTTPATPVKAEDL